MPDSLFVPKLAFDNPRPSPKAVDPFNTRAPNKDQSRVSSPAFPPKVDPTFALIAAAEMHNQGRLIDDGTK